MPPPAPHPEEERRLAALHALNILDTAARSASTGSRGWRSEVSGALVAERT